MSRDATRERLYQGNWKNPDNCCFSEMVLEPLELLLSFFASFVLELPVVREIMRWDMAVLRESPWYQEILKEGLERGQQ